MSRRLAALSVLPLPAAVLALAAWVAQLPPAAERFKEWALWVAALGAAIAAVWVVLRWPVRWVAIGGWRMLFRALMRDEDAKAAYARMLTNDVLKPQVDMLTQAAERIGSCAGTLEEFAKRTEGWEQRLDQIEADVRVLLMIEDRRRDERGPPDGVEKRQSGQRKEKP